MIPLLIGAFVLILFIVVTILSASTWRGWHIAAACLTFLSALALVVVASMSQKTHATWKSEYDTLEKELREERELAVKLEIGDPMLAEPEESPVNELQQRLSRLLLDRGRVWRRCVAPNPPENGRIAISTIPLGPDGTPGDPNAAQENGMTTGTILYGFRETQVPVSEDRAAFVPIAYLGEYRVVDAQPTRVTLTPTLPLDGQQRRLFNDTSASWALYEMMPIDSHRIFSREDTVGRPLDNTMEQPVFGEMDEERIRKIFATVTGSAPDAPVVNELVDPYLKDGYAASDQDVNLHPTNIWQKLEFEKEHSVQVDSPNPDMGVDSTFFDPGGYALSSHLRREGDEEASFRVNDIGLFPYGHNTNRQWVDNLVAEGMCQKIGPVYVRSLRDYEEGFHDIQRRFVQGKLEIAKSNRNIESLKSAISAAQKQIAYRQGEQDKLKEDQGGFERDSKKMAQFLDTLNDQKETLRDELSELHRTNAALSKQLAIYSAKLTEEINRRADSVAQN